MNQALSGNLDVKIALTRIDQARAQRRGTRAELFPEFNASTNAGRFDNPLPGIAPSGTRFNLYELGFDALWEVDLFGRVRRRVEAAIRRSRRGGGGLCPNARDADGRPGARLCRIPEPSGPAAHHALEPGHAAAHAETDGKAVRGRHRHAARCGAGAGPDRDHGGPDSRPRGRTRRHASADWKCWWGGSPVR